MTMRKAPKRKQPNTRGKKPPFFFFSINLLNVSPQLDRYQEVSRDRVKTVTSLSVHRARSVRSYAHLQIAETD